MSAPYKPVQIRWMREAWYEYKAVKSHYSNRTAERSKVPLINHIHQGLAIMATVGATLDAMKAYCLHPLFQNDSELWTKGLRYADGKIDGVPVVLAMEYRHRANAWLSERVGLAAGEEGLPEPYVKSGSPSWGSLVAVKHMLIGDKVQNYSDFVLHHRDTHARSEELEFYFQAWFEALGLNQADVFRLLEVARSEP